MPTWYKIKHKFSHEHNIEHNRSNISGALQSITGWSLRNYANVVIEKVYDLWQYIAVVMGMMLSIMGYLFEHCLKA